MARTQRENLREHIIEAAEKRLWYFGLKKTTIDEIATDAGVGKGTVYLYFDSKEEIAHAIMVKYKQDVLTQQAEIAASSNCAPAKRMRELLKLPVLRAHQICEKYPQAIEVIVTIKPQLSTRLRPYFDQEVELIAGVIEEGKQAGIFQVDDAVIAARTLKRATLGLLPPYPCLQDLGEIETEIDNLTDMGLRSFRP